MISFRFNDDVIIELEKRSVTNCFCYETTIYKCHKICVIDGVPQERETITIKKREYMTLDALNNMNETAHAEKYINSWIMSRFESSDIIEDEGEFIELAIF